MNLSDRLDAPTAAGWRPEPDDKIVGVIVDISEGAGDYGSYPIVTVDPGDGAELVAVHAFHSVLKSELARLKPAVGDEIGIKYEGKKQGKNQTYDNYKVALESARPRTPNWDAIGAEAAAENAAVGTDDLV